MMDKQQQELSQRRKMRLQYYDYSQPGCYFVTICVQNRRNLLGKVSDGMMLLNEAGRMVDEVLNELEARYAGGNLAEYVVMPNHLHFIWINRQPSVDLSALVPWLKITTTNRYIRAVKANAWPRFEQKLWQRGFFEHVVRSEEGYRQIAEYILNNPYQWHLDSLFQP